MKITLFKFGTSVLLLLFVSCGVNKREAIAILTAERDSLETVSIEKDLHLKEMSIYLDTLVATLDSIAYMESVIFLPDIENPNKPLSKQQLRERLEIFQGLLERQHNKIRVLEDSLASDSLTFSNMLSIITHLRTQIEEKNEEIEKMKIELSEKKQSISKLQTQVARLQSDVDELSPNVSYYQQVVNQQETIVETQDAMLNEGYYIVKSRKELAAMGIRANNMSVANINLDDFICVDIREFKSLYIPSGNIKILTQMPTNSYTLTNNMDGTYTLNINSPSDFWQYSKILIIQTR